MKMRSVRLGLMGCAIGIGGWATTNAADFPLALDGKCTVCLGTLGKLVDGKARFTSDYDGKTYRFPSAEQKEMFDADPAKFVPALGGDCVVCWVDMGQRVAGKPEHTVVHEGRLYLFPPEEQKRVSKKSPGKYAKADLALDGDCPVCLMKRNRVVVQEAEEEGYWAEVRAIPGCDCREAATAIYSGSASCVGTLSRGCAVSNVEETRTCTDS